MLQWKRKETCALLAAEHWKGRCALQAEQQQAADVPPLQVANARVGRLLAGRADEEVTLQCSADTPSASLSALLLPSRSFTSFPSRLTPTTPPSTRSSGVS